MSFPHIFTNYVVTFKDEQDYLNCRMQYLQYCEDAVEPGVEFELYAISGMYPSGTCVIENITLIPTSSVGNDNIYFNNSSSSIAIDTSTMESSSSAIYHINPPFSQTYEGNFVVGEPGIPAEDIASAIWDTNISYSVGVDLAYNNDGEISDVKVKAVEHKKEEPPDIPVKNRWNILDLRRDNNED